jgi:hypothetical protein
VNVPRVKWDIAEIGPSDGGGGMSPIRESPPSGSRVFETGVDRGMLYVKPFAGVAWNGLVSISETPSDRGINEYYIDGVKYLAVAGLEEYAATIEAFSSPPEFAPCTGFLKLSSGLFADGQPGKQFGFAYRTLIGDDLQGTSLGYKVHLVYNVLARTEDFSNDSIGDSSNVTPRSWSVTAVPETATAFKPTSHFVVDSRRIDSGVLSAIEDVLYGTVSTDPRLPSIEELVTMVTP